MRIYFITWLRWLGYVPREDIDALASRVIALESRLTELETEVLAREMWRRSV